MVSVGGFARGPLPALAAVMCGVLVGAALESRRAAAQEATAQNSAAAPNTSAAQSASSSTLPTINVVGVSPIKPPPVQRKSASSSGAGANARGAAAGPAVSSAAVTITHAEPGVIDRDKVPSNIQTISASDFDHTVTPSLLDAISRALPGVALSDQTGNPFQLDLNYRGFIASPVIGTPQGIAVYQNGVRINEVFGDIVNWDFIPENAINQMTMVPSNPIYGLNAIGGAMTFDMKNGFTYQGLSGEVSGGSFGRATTSVEAGGQKGNLSAYITADATNDAGWRNDSPSQLKRVYADFGARGDQTEFHLTFTGADNTFGAAAATPVELLNQDWSSIYTVPQTTHNQLAFVTGSGTWKPTDTVTVQGNLYYRGFWQSHVDGNGTDAENSPAICTAAPGFVCYPDIFGVYSPLTSTSGGPVPATGALAFPNVLGEIDRTWTSTNSFGGSAQVSSSERLLAHENNFTAGVSIDRGLVQFSENSELGTINANQFPTVQGVGVYIDQPSGDVAPVGLGARTLYTGLYATDTFDVTSRLSVTGGARFNDAQIVLTDELGNAPGLNAVHDYNRINPTFGAAFKLTPEVTLYGSYSEANRAPTPLELGCSDPTRPCLIDSALVGDPDLKQVVSHTVEGGLRGHFNVAGGLFNWNAGVYRTVNVNDILDAVASAAISQFAYFQNVGNTLRQGVEAGASYKLNRWNAYANFTYVDATFLNALTLSSPNNPFADANGNISVVPGDHLTGIPDFRFKAGAEYQITDPWKLGADINVTGSQWLVGDESNQNPKVPAYWTVNLHSSYQLTKNIQLYGLIRNLFNQRYYVYGTFFDTTFPSYLNLSDPRTFLPGMPFAAYFGARATF